MRNYFKTIDQFAISLAKVVIHYRYTIILSSIIIALIIGYQASHLAFSNNYRAFFSSENPELTAFEKLQATYTKNDNISFVLAPQNGQVFSTSTLKAVEELTEAAWQIPFALRVDSISNYQHTYSEDDDLIVESLISDASTLNDESLQQKTKIALQEPLLKDLLITQDQRATAVNVTLQYPENSLEEVPLAVAKAREIKRALQSQYPDLSIHLSGVSMLNNAFTEAGQSDLQSLVPFMFLIILVLTCFILRSFYATLSVLLIIVLSTMIAMGCAGLTGINLTPLSASAPIIILTLAIADSIHILISLRSSMKEGLTKHEALLEAIRLNFLPVTITSITTIVGFLALNFSDSPPFWHLGNITAIGIACAWLYSITLLPALMSLFPFKTTVTSNKQASNRALDHIADFVITYPKSLLFALGALSIIFISFIPRIELNDQWTTYFSENVEFRRDSDATQQYFGLYPIEFSVPSGNANGINSPEYLANLEKFSDFLRSQSHVVHVYSLVDIMKRLNKNLHNDDESYYRLPSDQNMSAQYLLLYEMSLPYGLDLNDRVNIDKSATRVTATLGATNTQQTKQFLETTKSWMRDNLPESMQATPTSAQVMFTYISERNIHYMIQGTLIAVIAISIIMIFALQSVRMGLLSLIPNGLPILTTFGVWALINGEVGFSIAIVASVSLGIIVDDTVHFLSKYVRARNERGLSAQNSVRYAFQNVGFAIIVNTTILTVGFLILLLSNFKINNDLGSLTALSITLALVLDFLFLPALLIVITKKDNQPSTSHE